MSCANAGDVGNGASSKESSEYALVAGLGEEISSRNGEYGLLTADMELLVVDVGDGGRKPKLLLGE